MNPQNLEFDVRAPRRNRTLRDRGSWAIRFNRGVTNRKRTVASKELEFCFSDDFPKTRKSQANLIGDAAEYPRQLK